MQTQIAPTPKTNGSVQKKEPEYRVLKTTNYDKFQFMPDNRVINDLHVKRLVQSFNERYLISPIIVNENHEVIDGQHRLTACKETGHPIYYIVIPGYSITEVQIFNSNQKNWTKLDFLNMFCAEGRKQYLDFRQFMIQFPDFGIQASERILTLKTSNNVGKQRKIGGKKMHMKDFEEGKLFIPDLNKSYIIARKLLDFKPFYSNFSRGTFVSALMPLFRNKIYDHKEMIHKLTSCPIKLTDCDKVESYKLLLEDIYNYKRQKDNKVSFRYA